MRFYSFDVFFLEVLVGSVVAEFALVVVAEVLQVARVDVAVVAEVAVAVVAEVAPSNCYTN